MSQLLSHQLRFNEEQNAQIGNYVLELVNSYCEQNTSSFHVHAEISLCLGTGFKFQFDLLYGHWNRILDVMRADLEKEDERYGLSTVHLLERIFGSLGTRCDEAVLHCWRSLISEIIPLAIAKNDKSINCGICSITAYLTSAIFELFDQNVQNYLITFLLGFCSEPHTSIQSAACRTLGIFVSFTRLNQDLLFMNDLSEALQGLIGAKSLTLLRAGWVLGNLSQSLMDYLLTNDEADYEMASFIFNKLLKFVLRSQKNDKTMSNIVRAAGNLLRIATDRIIPDAKFELTVCDLIKVLIVGVASNCSKTVWNSAHAAQHLFLNDYLINYNHEALTEQMVILTKKLIELALNNSNYKIKINCIQSLLLCPLLLFDKDIKSMLRLVKERVNSEFMSIDYNYREKLLSLLQNV